MILQIRFERSKLMSIITDHHVHTDFSDDCNTPMEDIIKRAIKLGLKEVLFTDHVDFDYPDKNMPYEINYDIYMEELKSLKNKYKEIEILMGVEIGYQPHLNNRLNLLLNSYPFDFVISSIHSCEGTEFCSGGFFKGKTQKESYEVYFKNLKYSVENFDNCDVYGHLDFIVRYGNFHNKVLKYLDFKEIIDEILYLIVRKGKGIELNTSGIRYGLGIMHPQIDILKRYHKLGGEIITLGSDAHNAKELCSDFGKAIEILKEVGFTRITKFKKRKPTFIYI